MSLDAGNPRPCVCCDCRRRSEAIWRQPLNGVPCQVQLSSLIEEVSSGKRKGEEGGSSGASKKHRWMTVDELEESRFGRSKSYGRVHCKATYKCAPSSVEGLYGSSASREQALRGYMKSHIDRRRD
ncbi:hypothetical protein ANCDUO_04145 [Ancylostoma duodenale]|uniref:Uncharacterized protein n=1 Tax=Ancylostoma duodenale TaxID=51022 RepID=A0A0C2GVP7_9BILA|nr:hypothetical protein ANCDUO_04145 [Ancylostoma duodenale]